MADVPDFVPLPPTAMVPAIPPLPKPKAPPLNRDRLAEIRWSLRGPPCIGCLLCVGKQEDTRYLADLVAEMEAEVARAPTEALPTVGGSEFGRGWRAACAFLSSEVGEQLTRGKIAGWDTLRMRQAVGELIEVARRRRVEL